MHTSVPIRAVLLAVALIAVAAVPALAAPLAGPPAIEWEKLLGGSGNEVELSLDQTADGGYIAVAYSDSSLSGDVAMATHGGYDIWVVKLDRTGTIQWQQLLGGSANEYDIEGPSVQQTADGGYILAGTSSSSASGDVTGTHHGGEDIWVVKLDAAGQTQWQRLYGGSGAERARSVQQTLDGGYILLGSTHSDAGGDVWDGTHGGFDAWVAKLDDTGAVQWNAPLGGSGDDVGCSIQQSAEGAYILLADSLSNASWNVVGTNHGGWDLWVAKIGAMGSVGAQQTLLGGSGDEYGREIRPTADDGYVLVGYSNSSASGNVADISNGKNDLWAVKLSAALAVEWQQLYGGSDNEWGRAVLPTADGGYLLLGDTMSSESGDVAGVNHGGTSSYASDIWAVKVNSAGALEWQQLYGGDYGDNGRVVQQTSDGGYVLAGFSRSSASGDVAGTNHGPYDSTDIWVVKLMAPAAVQVPGGLGLPTDTNGDGKFDDVNGNRRADFADVVLYFNQMSWIAANEPVSLFDYNGNGRIDFADVVWLFTNL